MGGLVIANSPIMSEGHLDCFPQWIYRGVIRHLEYGEVDPDECLVTMWSGEMGVVNTAYRGLWEL